MPVYSDTFAGTNGSPLGVMEVGGLTYVYPNGGTWVRQSGKAVLTTAGTGGHPTSFALVNTPSSDVDITALLGVGDAVYFRTVDQQNYWRVLRHLNVITSGPEQGSYYYTYVQKISQDPGAGQLGNVSITQTGGATATVRVKALGDTIQVYVNSALVATQIDVPALWNNTMHGIGRPDNTGTGSNIDSITITTLQPPAPTIASPINGGLVSSATPTLIANLGTYERFTAAEWQIATDTGFTANLRTVKSATVASTGQVSVDVPLADKLAKGAWYARARQVDSNNKFGDWSATHSFTVTHVPSTTNHSPTSGVGVNRTSPIRFSWTYTDPWAGDSQKNYQVVIERNDTGALVYDTGKITSTAQFTDYTVAVGLQDVQLRWKVMVWDQEDTASSFSNYQLFLPSIPGVVNITYPVHNNVVETSNPTITWTYTPQGGRGQASFRVIATRVSDSVVVHDSGQITSSALTYTATSGYIVNTGVYDIKVSSTDTATIVATDTNRTTGQFVPPDDVLFTADGTQYESVGYVNLQWTTVPDTAFLFWRINRRKVGEAQFTTIAKIADSSARSYRDWLAGSNTEYEYVVHQTVTRFNSEVDSDELISPVVSVGAGGYWLLNADDFDSSARLHNVTADSYRSNRERTELNVIGRGRHVDIGQNIGKTGSLTGQLRSEGNSSATEKLEALDGVIDSGSLVYLRTPFGKVWKVSLGDMDVARIAGVGLSEFVDVTIPYSEVF